MTVKSVRKPKTGRKTTTANQTQLAKKSCRKPRPAEVARKAQKNETMNFSEFDEFSLCISDSPLAEHQQNPGRKSVPVDTPKSLGSKQMLSVDIGREVSTSTPHVIPKIPVLNLRNAFDISGTEAGAGSFLQSPFISSSVRNSGIVHTSSPRVDSGYIADGSRSSIQSDRCHSSDIAGTPLGDLSAISNISHTSDAGDLSLQPDGPLPSIDENKEVDFSNLKRKSYPNSRRQSEEHEKATGQDYRLKLQQVNNLEDLSSDVRKLSPMDEKSDAHPSHLNQENPPRSHRLLEKSQNVATRQKHKSKPDTHIEVDDMNWDDPSSGINKMLKTLDSLSLMAKGDDIECDIVFDDESHNVDSAGRGVHTENTSQAKSDRSTEILTPEMPFTRQAARLCSTQKTGDFKIKF